MGLIAKLEELGLLIMEETGEWTSQGEREGPTAQSDVSEGEGPSAEYPIIWRGAQSIPQLVIESAEHKSQSGNTTHCPILKELARRYGETSEKSVLVSF